MSLLDTASLIVTPNGYKEGKLYSVIPSDGSGDMSVTRATTATRVNSAGLVELVPYNLLSWSEDLTNAAWTSINTTEVIGATAPDGTATAWTLSKSAANGRLYQVPASTDGSMVASVYAKAGTLNQVAIEMNTSYRVLDLSTGTLVSGGSGSYNIENVGNGWYRFSVVDTTYSGVAIWANPASSTSGNILIWHPQVEAGTTATTYQKTETRLNIPRLDYSNGTCPSLLVEPQRTNVCPYSNNLNGWINQTGNTTLTRINSGGADGGAFDRLVTTGSGNQGRYVQYTSLTGSNATFSVYLRGTGTVELGIYNAGQSSLDTITLTSEWTRYETKITSGTSGYIDWSIFVFGGNTTDVSCAQMEFASYATSYIPTTSASVTRNADVISKTGISSLIGQTEGTLYAEIYAKQAGSATNWYEINDGTSNNWIFIGKELNKMRGYIRTSGTTHFDNTTFTITDNAPMKVALAYKSGDYALYINGSLIASGSSSFTISGTISNVNIGSGLIPIGDSSAYKATALWKTRLTNTQLAALTTI